MKTGIWLKPNSELRIDMVSNPHYIGKLQVLNDALHDYHTNQGMSRELNGTQNEIQAIYGEQQEQPRQMNRRQVRVISNYRPQSGQTLLPTSGNYQRQSLGVCEQFQTDLGRGDVAHLHGGRFAGDVHASVDDIKQLYQFVGRDEAMLFIVSQLVTQSGIQCLLMMSTHADTYQDWVNGIFTPLLRFGGRQFCPSSYSRNKRIDVYSKGESIEVWYHGEGNSQQASLEKKGSQIALATAKLPPQYGLKKLEGTFAIRLKRNGNTIEMNLFKAELLIVTN